MILVERNVNLVTMRVAERELRDKKQSIML